MSKQCPTCSHRKEMFFADGTICPTCGRRASLLLRDVEHSSGVRLDGIESLKTALRIKTEEHDCCAEDNIELRNQLTACEIERDIYLERINADAKKLAAITKERDELVKDAELYRQAQRACRDLPFGWEITINLEKDAGTVSLFNPDGDEEQFPSNRETLGDELSDAIDAALAGESK